MDTWKNLPMLTFRDAADWLEWLETNHPASDGAWLRFAKKGTGIPSITYEEARDGAIMYGWIDGLLNRYDESSYLVRFTPRRKRSLWSKINRDIAEALITKGSMKPSGVLEVERAMADGRWDAAYSSQSSIPVPPDFQAALDAEPEAARYFDGLSSSNRYAFLFRITTAKTAVVRARRIAKSIEMLREGSVHHPERK